MQAAPKDAKDGYVSVDSAAAGGQESIPAPTLVATAYGAIWVIVLAFVLSMWKRNKALEAEIDDLARRIK